MGVTQTTGTQIKDGTVGVVDMSATGTPSSTTFLRGDNSWAIPTSSSGGVSTLSAIGTNPNANGATIIGTILNLEAASVSFPGILTTGLQTFAGNKIFNNQIAIGTTPISNVMVTARSNPTQILPFCIFNRNATQGWAFNVDAQSVDDGIFGILNQSSLVTMLGISPVGNVGIGTNNGLATQKLEVGGNIKASGVFISVTLATGGTVPVTSGILNTVVVDANGLLSRVPLGVGSGNLTVTTLTSNTTLTTAVNQILLADTTTGVFTITLPTAVGNSGIAYTIKKINLGNDLTIATTLSQTIDDGLTVVLKTQYTSIDIVSNGTNWFIV